MSNRFSAVRVAAVLTTLAVTLGGCAGTVGDQSVLYPNRGNGICFYTVQEISVRAPDAQKLTVVVGDVRYGSDRVRDEFTQSFVGNDEWMRGVRSDTRDNNFDVRTNPGNVVGVSVYDEDGRLAGFNPIYRMPNGCGGPSGKAIAFNARISVVYVDGYAKVRNKADLRRQR